MELYLFALLALVGWLGLMRMLRALLDRVTSSYRRRTP